MWTKVMATMMRRYNKTSLRRLLFLLALGCCRTLFSHPFSAAFVTPTVSRLSRPHLHRYDDARIPTPRPPLPKSSSSSSSLFLLLDVPDGFFTVTFPMLGILLSISKSFARVRMEERAWEQRLEEARRERLRRDPTLTELDLRRQEAALEWSAYGQPRQQQQQQQEEEEKEQQQGQRRPGGRRRVTVLEREIPYDKQDAKVDSSRYKMTDAEIQGFERDYGIDYDPYYDDPYTAEELPPGRFQTDKIYGDRIYDSGEIFYKDARTGLYYRQGAKPRSLTFWR